MDKRKVVANLREIEALVAECLKETGEVNLRPNRQTAVRAGSANALMGRILRLRSSSFFKQARTAKEVHAKLRPDYDCDLNRIQVALLRLQNRRELRRIVRKSTGGRQVGYVW